MKLLGFLLGRFQSLVHVFPQCLHSPDWLAEQTDTRWQFATLDGSFDGHPMAAEDLR